MRNPLDYLGVRSKNPPQLTKRPFRPTVNDCKNFQLGDLWINNDPTLGAGNAELYQLINLEQGSANWALLYPTNADASTFRTDAGDAHVAANIINVIGDGEVITTGAGNTVTVKLTQAAGGVAGGNGMVLIGATGAEATWANLTSVGGSINFSEGPNTLNLEAVGGGGGGVSSLTTDAGTANQVAGNIYVLGLTGGNIITTAAGDKVYIDVDNDLVIDNLTLNNVTNGVVISDALGHLSSSSGSGADGQVLISAAGGLPAWANLTAGSGISITNSANSISIAATGGGGGGMPVGSIVRFDLGNIAGKLPVGWLYCDGSVVNRTAYPVLYNTIGQYYLSNTGNVSRRYLISSSTPTDLTAAAYGSTMATPIWVMLSNVASIYFTVDAAGTGISNYGLPGSFAAQDVVFGDGKFVMVGSKGSIYYSADGLAWTAATSTFLATDIINAIAHNGVAGAGSLFVAVGSNGKIAYSVDGTNWTMEALSPLGAVNITNVKYGNGQWLANRELNSYIYSADGINWTLNTLTNNLVDYAYGSGKWVSLQGTKQINTIYSSVDGINWVLIPTALNNTPPSTNTFVSLEFITYEGGLFMIGGQTGRPDPQLLWSSVDGLKWTVLNTFPCEKDPYITGATMNFASYGANGIWIVGANRLTSQFASQYNFSKFVLPDITTEFCLPNLQQRMGPPHYGGYLYDKNTSTGQGFWPGGTVYIDEPGYIIKYN